MIKAVIFDMVGPLLTKDPKYRSDGIVETAEALRERSKDDEEFLEKLKEDPETKGLELNEILKKIVDKYSKVEPVWNILLPELKKQNYMLAVINNGTGLTLDGFKRKNNFSEYFDIFINSSEEKMEKPDPRIYLLACERLGVAPEECVFIDDMQENVSAARKLGMTGFVYRDYQKLIDDLTSIHVVLA
jgi:epoxide hydrolase-like predicted phosphatase